MSNRWLNLLFFAAAPFLLVQNRAVAQSAPPLDPLSLTATASGEAAGDHLLVHGEFLAAISAYSTAPVDADTLNKIGVAWQHLSAVEQARKDYEMALLLRPNFAEALSNLASAYYVEKDYRHALHLYQRAFSLDPQSAIIAANLGTAYFAEDKYELGLDAYKTAYALDPAALDFDLTRMIEGATPKRVRARRDYSLAEVFASQNVNDRALDYLRRAMGEGFRDWKRVMRDPAFARLRNTPEFAHLMLGA